MTTFVQYCFSYFLEFSRNNPGLIHEIANPLTTATNAIEMVLRDAEPGLQYKPTSINDLTVSLECLQHIQSLLKQNQVPLHFSLQQEIQTILRIYKAKCQEKGIKIELKIPQQLRFEGNPIRFRQAVGNLVSNAIDAYADVNLPTNLPRILIQAQEEHHSLILTIQDYGTGIPHKAIRHIFRPFFTTKPEDKGTGLGLSIVKRIIEKEFRGKVELHSEVNRGTTFILKLPKRTSRRLGLGHVI